jgi:hypothetical protein
MAHRIDGHVVRGSEALREYAEAHMRVLRGRHMTLNHLYEVSGDRATGRATTVVSIATPRATRLWGGALTMTISSRSTTNGKFVGAGS